jgi:hypothetical protein
VNVQEHQITLGQVGGAATVARVPIVRDLSYDKVHAGPPAYPLLCVVENTGDAAFTLTVEGSGTNEQTSDPDNYDAVQLRVNGANVNGATGFAVVAGARIPFLIEGITDTQATGSIDFVGVLTDEDIITISDGISTVVFEFDDDSVVDPNNTGFVGVGAPAQIAALIVAINASVLRIDAVAGAGDSADLTAQLLTGGNETITDVEAAANITVAGMTGGVLRYAEYIRFTPSTVAARGAVSIAHYTGILELRGRAGTP